MAEPLGQALPGAEGPYSLSPAPKTGQVEGKVGSPKQFGLDRHTERSIERMFKGSDMTTILHESTVWEARGPMSIAAYVRI